MKQRSATDDITSLLSAWSSGDKEAQHRLLETLYDELRSRARHLMLGERHGHSISATALVHEVYLRFVNQSGTSWKNRGHFLAVASTVMRRVLVDYARARNSAKRGGQWQSLTLDVSEIEDPSIAPSLIEVDDALEALAAIDEMQARLIELRFFGGLTIDETAELLEISPATAKREWQMARAWLWRRLQAETPQAEPR